MKTYFLVLALLVFFSFSLEAQTKKRVNKKPKVEQKKVKPNAKRASLPFKGSDEELQAKSSNRLLKGNKKVVDHKSDDQKLRKGTPRVVDHKADDQKLRKERRGNRQNLKQRNKLGRRGKNKAGSRNRTVAKRKRGNNR
ncbi:MAG TPA: OadG family protein [Saprospiraceae bacterium]|nr:OadG family protein [Saprospiraceae bacterium]